MEHRTNKSLPELTLDFLTEEQKQRRHELEGFGSRMERDQRNALLITGAIWSWLATNLEKLPHQGLFEKFVVFIPALIMGFFFYRWWAMNRAVSQIAEYTRMLERKAGVDLEKLGWETWLHERRKLKQAVQLGTTAWIFWISLLLVNALLAFLLDRSRAWF